MTGTHSHLPVDGSAAGTDAGIRALKISTAGLLATAAVQLYIATLGGSTALFADAMHNLSDVFTAVLLWVAFSASRRAATKKYTFGYDRFEDLAGIAIVLIVALSAVLAGIESYRALIQGRVVTQVGLSLAAAAVGVVGNEIVARYKISVGRRIHSVALIADGRHSRIDALVSVGAFAGVTGAALGFPAADPIAGLVITVGIVWITVATARDVIVRITDAVDPEIIEKVHSVTRSIEGVAGAHEVRARWAGRSLFVQMHLEVSAQSTLSEAHDIGEQVRDAVIHEVPGVVDVLVHLDPEESEQPPGPRG